MRSKLNIRTSMVLTVLLALRHRWTSNKDLGRATGFKRVQMHHAMTELRRLRLVKRTVSLQDTRHSMWKLA